MTTAPPDRPDLPGWSDLPFWRDSWPALRSRLAAEPRPVLPPADAMFAALRLTAPEDVRVIILGQDPYHTPGKADGLAFSIQPGFGGRLDSLGNIFRELQADVRVTRTRTDLSDWASQGVLMLNTALSVAEGAAQSHARIGWQPLVDQVLSRAATHPVTAVLWGSAAQRYAPVFADPAHLVIRSAHPSPLSAHRGFLGSQPFSRIDAWLAARGMRPIDWGGSPRALLSNAPDAG